MNGPFFKMILALVFVYAIFVFGQGIMRAEAATVTAPFMGPGGSVLCPGCKGYSPWTGTYQKVFDIIMPNGTNALSSFVLDPGSRVSFREQKTTGQWAFLHLNVPMDGMVYAVKVPGLNSVWGSDGQYHNTGVTTIGESMGARVTSSDPSVLVCDDSGCEAIKNGTANITVSFPDRVQTNSRGNPFHGDNLGYGLSTLIYQLCYSKGCYATTGSPYLSYAYSLPDITYEVRVGDDINKSHVVSYIGADVSLPSANINWTYSDPENDAQSNWQVQIATDSAFTNIIRNSTASGGRDESSIRNTSVSGLVAGETYYARVRGYNDVNAWSDWSSGEFTTVTDDTKNGEPYVSCSAIPTLLNVTEGAKSVTFSAVLSNAPTPYVYEWSREGSSIGGNSSSVSVTYSPNDQARRDESVLIRITDAEGVVHERSCVISVFDSNVDSESPNSPKDDDDSNQTGENLIVKDYRLSPNIVGAGGSCPVYFEAENVSQCVLRRAGVDTTLPLPVNGKLSISGDTKVTIGTHVLFCAGVAKEGEGQPALQNFGSKQCISNPDISER